MTASSDVRIRAATAADRAGVVTCVNAAYQQYIAAIERSRRRCSPTWPETEADAEALRSGHDEIRLYTNEKMMANLAYYPRRGFVETHRVEEDGYRRVYFSRRVR